MTISLRRCRSYHDCSTLLERFLRWCISWVSNIIFPFFPSFQTSNINRRINADLIHLALLQQEQMLFEIEIAQIVNRRRRRRRPRRYCVQSWLYLQIGGFQLGHYGTLLWELWMEDTISFLNGLSMEPAMLQTVGSMIRRKIQAGETC